MPGCAWWVLDSLGRMAQKGSDIQPSGSQATSRRSSVTQRQGGSVHVPIRFIFTHEEKEVKRESRRGRGVRGCSEAVLTGYIRGPYSSLLPFTVAIASSKAVL